MNKYIISINIRVSVGKPNEYYINIYNNLFARVPNIVEEKEFRIYPGKQRIDNIHVFSINSVIKAKEEDKNLFEEFLKQEKEIYSFKIIEE